MHDGVHIHRGFPNFQEESEDIPLDLNKLLLPHPISSFMFSVSGNNWEAIGVFDGDIAIADRSISANSSDIIIWHDPEGSTFNISHHKKLPEQAVVWGTVTAIIHRTRIFRR